MPIPVSIPSGQRSITNADVTRAEELVAAIIQILKSGTSGGSTNTPASTYPTGPNQALQAVELSSPEQQLFLRTLAQAIVTSAAQLASATQFGVTKLSTDPSSSNPVALNSEEVTTTPGPNKVPRAKSDGLLDSAWIGSTSGTAVSDHVFDGTCVAADAVGDLVYISGSSKAVAKADITNSAKVPCVGCIISKPSATTCKVQTSGLVSGVYSGLTPGKIYVVGTNSRPTLTLPTPGSGSSLFLQGVGIAIDTNMLLISPASQLTLIKG
jgi:hypothetical protein